VREEFSGLVIPRSVSDEESAVKEQKYRSWSARDDNKIRLEVGTWKF
jgi:hypothetical protein